MDKKHFTLTRDDKGYAMWPEDAVLNINDEEVFDENCEVRGIDSLVDFIDELVVLDDYFDREKKEYKKGVIIEFDVIVRGTTNDT